MCQIFFYVELLESYQKGPKYAWGRQKGVMKICGYVKLTPTQHSIDSLNDESFPFFLILCCYS